MKDIPLIGTGFVLRLNGQNVYGGWIWNMVSSFGCDRVWTFQIPTDGQLQLNFGLGGFECGMDPRTDENRIRNAIDGGK